MSDDADSLFGSRPSSPVAATHAGRSAQAELALPGLALPSGTQNVGTIALPGLHVRIEQPAAASSSPRLPLTPSTPSTRQPTPLPRPALRLSLKRPPAKAPPEPSLKRKRPAPDLDLPGPGEPLPRNLLRNHNALLGTAGRVAGLKLPAVGSGSSRSDPVLVDDDSARSSTHSASGPTAATPAPSSASASASETASRDPLVRLQRNPNFISVLRGLLAHTTMQRRGYHAMGRPPPPKKRRLSRVPSGAQDWDVPYPFPNGEGPQHYDETWSEKRGAKLVKDLVKLVSEAVSDAQPAAPVNANADANITATDGQHAIASSVNNWLDNLWNTPAPSTSALTGDSSLGELQIPNILLNGVSFDPPNLASQPVAPASDSFDTFDGVDSLQSLMALYEKESDESLFSTLFGADMNQFGSGNTSSVPTSALHLPAEVPDTAIDPELFAIAQQQLSNQFLAPWPTPESSLFGQDEGGWTSMLLADGMPIGAGVDDPSPATNMQDSGQPALDAGAFDTQETADVLADSAAFEDAIKSLLASMPNVYDAQMQSMNQHQPHFPHAIDPTASALPLTPISLATPTFTSPHRSAVSLVDPSTLEPFTHALSAPALPAAASLPQTVPPTPSVADPPQSATPSPAPEGAAPFWTTKVEKKSVLLAQALAQRARLQAELDQAQHDIWACTVEDGVLHRLLYPPK